MDEPVDIDRSGPCKLRKPSGDKAQALLAGDDAETAAVKHALTGDMKRPLFLKAANKLGAEAADAVKLTQAGLVTASQSNKVADKLGVVGVAEKPERQPALPPEMTQGLVCGHRTGLTFEVHIERPEHRI